MSPTPPGPQQPQAGGYPVYPQPGSGGDGRPVSFYLAIFLGMLLVLSAGLNLVLLFVGVIGSAAGSFVALDEGDDQYRVVAVGGDGEARDKILRLPVEGAISEQASPLLGASGGTVTRIERALKLARRDDTIKGVLLVVDSPGGGVTDSDLIYRAIKAFRDETGKPVIARFEDLAASGGYYIACACEQILASETTITGSIGVVMSNWNYAEAAKKVGIQSVDIVSARTPHKTMLSGAEPVDPVQVEIARSIIDEMYDRFVDVVAAGRPNLERDRIVELADGRIYSAQQARQAGLIDGIGTEEEAIALLKNKAKLDAAKVVEHRRRLSLFDALTGAGTPPPPPSLEQALGQFLTKTTGPRLLYFWHGGR
jgi:protease-4